MRAAYAITPSGPTVRCVYVTPAVVLSFAFQTRVVDSDSGRRPEKAAAFNSSNVAAARASLQRAKAAEEREEAGVEAAAGEGEGAGDGGGRLGPAMPRRGVGAAVKGDGANGGGWGRSELRGTGAEPPPARDTHAGDGAAGGGVV